MNPKEKATQLFNKYYVSILGLNNDLSEEVIISILTKKHSLIAVDEILSLLFLSQAEINYWIEVKNEIEKL